MLFHVMLLWFLLALSFYITDGHYDPHERLQVVGPGHETRRILKGVEIFDTRPYMVYLRPAKVNPFMDPNWLCGGVIVHPRYILTSAACIEDVTHFYIVSGTHKWVPPKETNLCIKNGATKAIWKCVPKNYRFDGAQFNNIRWMTNDIAVVMTAEPINFARRVRGCDFIPQMIKFNNESAEHELPETPASVAGWGSVDEYTDPADFVDLETATDVMPEISRAHSVNSVQLMEADVEIIPKGNCKSFWHRRYHDIIDNYMICGKNIDYDELHTECEENHMDCREMKYSSEDGGKVDIGGKVEGEGKPEEPGEEDIVRRLGKKKFQRLVLTSLRRLRILRRARQKSLRREGKDIGGFCENDHGGPLITGKGKTSMVVGIISAYRTLNSSKKCVGPFLYTSVFNNRNLINCAINKELGKQCRTVLRESSTVLDQERISWGDEFKENKVPRAKPIKPKKRHHSSKNKTQKSNHTKLTASHLGHLGAVKLVHNPQDLTANLVHVNRAEKLEINSTKNVTDKILPDQGALASKVRRHVPLRKRSGRVRLGRHRTARRIHKPRYE